MMFEPARCRRPVTVEATPSSVVSRCVVGEGGIVDQKQPGGKRRARSRKKEIAGYEPYNHAERVSPIRVMTF